jgi:hypothetical protein
LIGWYSEGLFGILFLVLAAGFEVLGGIGILFDLG